MDDHAGQPDAPVCDVNELSKGRRQVLNGMTHVGRMQVKVPKLLMSSSRAAETHCSIECLIHVMSQSFMDKSWLLPVPQECSARRKKQLLIEQ